MSLLNEILIVVDDSNTVAEVIASTVAVINGADMDDLLKSFDSRTAAVVGNALATIRKNDITQYANTGVIKL